MRYPACLGRKIAAKLERRRERFVQLSAADELPNAQFASLSSGRSWNGQLARSGGDTRCT